MSDTPRRPHDEVLAPTSEGAATYVDFSRTREEPKDKVPREELGFGSVGRLKRRGNVARPVPRGYMSVFFLAVAVVFLLMLVYMKGYLSISSHKRARIVPSSPQEEMIHVSVEPGASATRICALLEQRGVVESAQELLGLLVSNGWETSVRSGEYAFPERSDPLTVATALTQTPALLEWCVIQPGWTLKQVDEYLSQRGYADEGRFLEASRSVAEANGLSFAEGWFLSGSYGERKPLQLAEAMYQGMIDALYPYLEEPVIHRWGVEGVLTVASLVQAETQDVGQMPLIAGIIFNRMELGMPLGIDATTRYEIGDWTHPLKEDVFEKDTPYNTRRRPGLPPSGICCPSSEAVMAACKPQKSDALYYLHGKDGMIHTALDYEGHKGNIAKYL